MIWLTNGSSGQYTPVVLHEQLHSVWPVKLAQPPSKHSFAIAMLAQLGSHAPVQHAGMYWHAQSSTSGSTQLSPQHGWPKLSPPLDELSPPSLDAPPSLLLLSASDGSSSSPALSSSPSP